MSVTVTNGILYADGIPIYRVPDAEMPEPTQWVMDGVFYSDGVPQYRLAHPDKVQVVKVAE